jgi:hypothetical protein
MINVTRNDPNQPITGFPVFFAAKEGALGNEKSNLDAVKSTDGSFFKINHTITDKIANSFLIEQIEMGSKLNSNP